MQDLAAVGCPDLPVQQARQRWAAYIHSEADLELLDGDALLHTDFNPLNILLGPDRVWMIDWAWPTRGAAFIDAVLLLDPGDGGRSQREPGRSASWPVPGLAASPVRRH